MSLSKLYYNYSDPASLSSISKLKQKSKFSTEKIKHWLASQDAYTLHKPTHKSFPRKQYYVSTFNELIQMDLADMKNIAKYNDNYNYILCCIDVFSKHAHCIPVKTKKGIEMARVVERIIKRIGKPHPTHVQTDLGTEFYNKNVSQVFKKYHMNHYSVHSEMKAAVVERFIRTLKEKLYRFFTAKNTYRFVNILQDIVNNYNHSIHRSIKMAPEDVNENNVMQVWKTLYGNRVVSKNIQCKFHPGEYVRISRLKHKLHKGYLPKWSQEIFIIEKCLKSNPITYKIKDWNGEPIKGIFYTAELQKVIVDKKKSYLIEKVLKRKKGWVYVKWLGYPSSMNSWIRKKSLHSTK